MASRPGTSPCAPYGKGLVLVQPRTEISTRVIERIVDRLGRVGYGILIEQCDSQALLTRDEPLIGKQIPRKDLEERGLSAPVPPNQADAFAFVYGERDAV